MRSLLLSIPLLLLAGGQVAPKPSSNRASDPRAHSNLYPYPNKWAVPDDDPETWLKDTPVEVISRVYALTDSSLQEPADQLHEELIYRFDADGHCIYRRRNVYQDTTESYYRYTDSGYQYREEGLTKGGRQRTLLAMERSIPINSHSYRTQSFEKTKLTETSLTTFDADGNSTITWPPTDAAKQSERSWYANGRLVKKVYTDDGESETTLYTRDANGVLQSVTTNKDRDVYQNNDHGDPVISHKYLNGRLYSETCLRYEYDAHGNWTKRFWLTEPRGNYGFKVGQLQIRQIKYQ